MVYILRKTILPACGALAALLFGLTSPAGADDTIQFTDSGNSAAVTISLFGGAGESTVVGDYNFLVNGSKIPIAAFCTDPFDSIYYGENWTAKRGLTSDMMSKTNYPHGGAKNIPALDYIAQFYTPQPNAPYPSAAAAQLAIWDLVAGGHVSYTGGTYAWDAQTFQATGGFASASDQSDLAKVFAIEQAALYVNSGLLNLIPRTASSGSITWTPEQVNGYWSPTNSGYGREQDLLTRSVPEPGPTIILAGFAISGSFFMLRRRHRRKK